MVMKIKNIILIVVAFVFTAVSCSVEEDVLPSNNNNTNNSVVISDQEVYLAFNLNAETKAEEPKDTDAPKGAEVTSCSVVLFTTSDQIIAVEDNVVVSNNQLQDCSFLTKVRDDLNVAIIANTAQSFESCATMEDVREKVLNEEDLVRFVKYGEAKVDFGSEAGSTSTTNAPIITVNVALKEKVAVVELNSFKLNFDENAKKEEVTVTKVELVNANTETYTNAKGHSEISTLSNDINEKLEGDTEIKTTFHTFPNNDVSMKITYTVGGKEFSKSFQINKDNGGLVESAYIYRLNVTLIQNAHDVDVNVALSVNDWVGNTIRMDMTEGK